MEKQSLKTVTPMSWAVYVLATLFYFYEIFIRVAPSVMVHDLMDAFDIHAGTLGLLSAVYFYVILPLQIVAGVLMDRYGARRLLAFATLACGLGELLFANAGSFQVAMIGRGLMGFGSAFGFVGVIYIVSHFFPERKRTLLIALSNSVAMLGPIFGLGPTGALVNAIGWRSASNAFAIIGILLAVAIFLVVRKDDSSGGDKTSMEELWSLFRSVFKNSQSWIAGMLNFTLYAPIVAFAGFWATPFLKSAYGLDDAKAGYAASMIYVGQLIAGPLMGRIDQTRGRRQLLFILTSIVGALAISTVIYSLNLPLYALYPLLFLIGAMTASQLLTYAQAIDVNSDQAKGTVIAFTNTCAFIGGAILQPVVGFMLDAKWTGQMAGDTRVYSTESYQFALACFPAAFIFAGVLALFIIERQHKETGLIEPPS